MTSIKQTLLGFALCVAGVSVAHAQQLQGQTPAMNDSKLDALFPGAAGAQKQPAVGPPVTCTAKGYWSSTGDERLILKRLNATTGAVEIKGIDGNNRSWERNEFWVFKDGRLAYDRASKIRYRLVVSETALTGSYDNFQIRQLSRDPIIYACDGPTSRVIVR